MYMTDLPLRQYILFQLLSCPYMQIPDINTCHLPSVLILRLGFLRLISSSIYSEWLHLFQYNISHLFHLHHRLPENYGLSEYFSISPMPDRYLYLLFATHRLQLPLHPLILLYPLPGQTVIHYPVHPKNGFHTRYLYS